MKTTTVVNTSSTRLGTDYQPSVIGWPTHIIADAILLLSDNSRTVSLTTPGQTKRRDQDTGLHHDGDALKHHSTFYPPADLQGPDNDVHD
jgi:hypothetical protein